MFVISPGSCLNRGMSAVNFAMLLVFACAGLAQAAEPPARVVSLAPNLTQMMLSLGAENRLVAVTPFCEAPAAITRLPGGIQPEAEAIVDLSPDLVLATPLTPSVIRTQLKDLGFRVEIVDATSLEGIRSAISRLAGILGIAAPVNPAPTAAQTGSTAVLLFGANTGYSAARGTHAHDILEAAGLRNIAADTAGPWPQLGEEVLLAADPDYIIVADYGEATAQDVLASLRSQPVRRHLAAVRGGRVIVFPAEAFSIPGPAALQAAEKLRAAIHDFPDSAPRESGT